MSFDLKQQIKFLNIDSSHGICPIYLSFQNSVYLNLSTLKLALIATSLAAQIHNNNDKRHLGPSLHKDYPWMQSALIVLAIINAYQ